MLIKNSYNCNSRESPTHESYIYLDFEWLFSGNFYISGKNEVSSLISSYFQMSKSYWLSVQTLFSFPLNTPPNNSNDTRNGHVHLCEN